MNILTIVPYMPTPIRTRPYNFIRGLLQRGHHITLATLYENQEEWQELLSWESQKVTVLAVKLSRPRKVLNLLSALPTTKPLQSVFCWEPGLVHLVKEFWMKQVREDQEFDVVHVEHLRGAPFGLELQRWLNDLAKISGEKKQVPIIWDSVDCISLLFEKAARSSRSRFGRMAAAFDLPRTRHYEGWLAQQFAHTLVTAEADRAALVALVDRARSAQLTKTHKKDQNTPITVLPNGVDLTTFTPNYGKRQEATIVMTGKMSYHANVTAALYLVEEVMPQVWAQRPETAVQIVGANPPPEIRSLAIDYPGKVEVTGTVPDLVSYLQGATIAAAPIAYGVGIQNKVLEAMACAAPVVCTPQACSALKTQPGKDLLVGETPAELANHILSLLGNAELRQSVGIAGRQYVEKHHGWDAVVEQLEDIYRGSA